jgi:PAS domain S-box-containing protein
MEGHEDEAVAPRDAARASAASDPMLATMLDVLPERVSRYHRRTLEIRYCNPAWAAGHGTTPDEVVGRRLDDLLEGSELEGLAFALEHLPADGTPLVDTVIRPAPEGGQRYVEWVDRSVAGPDGEEILSVGRDVTARYLAQQESRWLAEQLATTLERMDDGLFTLDADWCITHVNRAGAALIRRSADALVGRVLWQAFPYLAGTGVETEIRRAVSDGAARRLDRVYDGHLAAWFDIDVVPTSRGTVIFLRDVTRHVEREELLQRTLTIEHEANESLRQLDRAKTAFLSAVSHELRTPVTVAYGMAVTLARFDERLTDDERREAHDALVEQTRHLGSLLDDLLDVDRLARGRIAADRRRTDAAELSRAVAARYEGRLDVQLEAPDTLRVDVDPVHLERILINLLDNAVKYAPGSLVELAVRPHRGGVRLDVRDHGPGLPSDERERVFEPFYRADERHPQPGTGIGLALVADFARIHDGAAWAEETDGDGAWFVVELPAPDDGDAEPGPPEQGPVVEGAAGGTATPAPADVPVPTPRSVEDHPAHDPVER